MLLTRRSFMASLLALAVAPAIVRAQSLMPLVRPVKLLPSFIYSRIAPSVLSSNIIQHIDQIDITTILSTHKEYAMGMAWYTGNCDLLVPEGRIVRLLADGEPYQPLTLSDIDNDVLHLRNIDLAPFGNRLPVFNFEVEQ